MNNSNKTHSLITLTTLNDKAAQFGGKCISTEYNPKEKVVWECSNGHIFEKYWGKVQSNSWCPYCKFLKGEETTRIIFETIFNKPFVKVTFKQINIPEGGKLELDGYNSDLRLAFEYNGAFHYEKRFPNQNFEQQQINDRRKIELCRKHNIKLITIKYFPRTDNLNKFEYIEAILRKNGISFDENYEKVINYPKVYDQHYYNKIKELVESKGGQLISTNIYDATTNVELRCDKGHNFKMSPHKIKTGEWCKHNMRNRALTEKDIEETIKHYGGKMMKLEKSKRNGYIVEYYCEQGHLQKKLANKVREGRWCNHKEHIGPGKLPKFSKRFDEFTLK